MDNLFNGYIALQNLTEINVDNIVAPDITTDTIIATTGNITNVNSTTVNTTNLNFSNAIGNHITVQGLTGTTGFIGNLRFNNATGNYANINFIDMQRLTGPTGYIGGFGANVIQANTIRVASSITGPTGFIQNIITQNLTGNSGYFTNIGTVNYTGSNSYSTNYSGVSYTGASGYFTNLRYVSSTGGATNVSSLNSTGDIFLLSSGVDSEIKILTSDNRVSKLSLKEFTDSYGFELFYNGATNNLNLNRRNANNVNIFNTSVIDGFTNWNAPINFTQGMSGNTGVFNSIATTSITGSTGYFTNIGCQSITGNLGVYKTIAFSDIGGGTGTFNLVIAQNIESTSATIGKINSNTGYYTNYLEVDNRVVNNYELCRGILRFYTENYYAGSVVPYTDPLVFTNNFQNGLIIDDSSYQSIVYLPARDGIVIPNGTPMYYYMNATNSSSISSIGTNLSSNLILPGGGVNRTYVFIFNIALSLYEYQGFINATSEPTANTFNSRANSFRLPQGRPNQFNLLSGLTNGGTEWTDDISVRNFTSTGANIAFITNQVMTGATGFFGNLNTSEDRLHLGNLAGATSQQLWAVAIGQEAGRTSQQNVGIAIGYRSGNNSQGSGGIAIGSETGQTSQRSNAIAIGVLCGRTAQQSQSISIGYQAGNTSQNSNSIAIGTNAGQNSQGSNSIAIGQNAGNSSQELQSIAIGFNCGQTSQRSNSLAIGMEAGRSNQQGSSIAIGFQCGNNSQGIGSISIGDRAGQNSQQTQSISIGTLSGGTRQGTGSISVGYLAGNTSQNTQAIAIGYEAGYTGQGLQSIAIGMRAGYSNQNAGSIILNASGNILNSDGADRFYVRPVRLTDRTTAMRDLFFNPLTYEITYSTFQDEIGGPIAIGAVFTTLFNMAGNGVYLLSINTRANDGNWGMFSCYQEEGATGLVVAINQNNILIQTAVGNAVQIRTVNGATYNFYYSARRLL